MDAARVTLDRFERAMVPLGALGGMIFGVGFLYVMADDTFVMLRGLLAMWLGFMLWASGWLAPIFRQRPWAITAGSVPAGVGMLLVFGAAGCSDGVRRRIDPPTSGAAWLQPHR